MMFAEAWGVLAAPFRVERLKPLKAAIPNQVRLGFHLRRDGQRSYRPKKCSSIQHWERIEEARSLFLW
jgi:hypothetical protein